AIAVGGKAGASLACLLAPHHIVGCIDDAITVVIAGHSYDQRSIDVKLRGAPHELRPDRGKINRVELAGETVEIEDVEVISKLWHKTIDEGYIQRAGERDRSRDEQLVVLCSRGVTPNFNLQMAFQTVKSLTVLAVDNVQRAERITRRDDARIVEA